MKKYSVLLMVAILAIAFVGTARAQSDENKNVKKVLGSSVQCSGAAAGECPPMLDYGYSVPKRFHFAAGVGGSYFVKKASARTTGNVGAYLGMDYRPMKYLSVGADVFYGWLFGQGHQYLSAFNPGVKIFPMAYSNPRFEPFFFVGAHVAELSFGDSSFRRYLMAQGGFAGAGFRWIPESAVMGMQAFVRASFLYREKPSPQTGRGFALPIFGMIGVVY